MEGVAGDEHFARLLWSEYSHVNRAVKTMQEILYTHKTIPYAEALEHSLSIYTSERITRAERGEPEARELDRLGRAARDEGIALAPFLDPISARLFQRNHGIQSSLILRDPVGAQAEHWIRSHLEEAVTTVRGATFHQLVRDFNAKFAEPHRRRAALLEALEDLADLPLGLQPIDIQFGDGSIVTFASRAAWASFVAKLDVWRQLPDAPPIPDDVLHVDESPSAAAVLPRGGFVSEVFFLANELTRASE